MFNGGIVGQKIEGKGSFIPDAPDCPGRFRLF